MADVTDEVWGAVIADGHPFVVCQVVPPAPEGMDYRADDLHLFSVGVRHEGTAEGRARTRLASMAPTLFRMLERVLQSATLSPELEEGIRTNLCRASPDTHSMPEPKGPRRSSWERLLDEPPV